MPLVAETAAKRNVLSNGVAISLSGIPCDGSKRARQECVLVLTGTSTQIRDVSHFTDFLAQKGHAVATVERFVGGPFDVGYDPKTERSDTLKAALSFLRETGKVERIHIVAHSYAAFETVRLLFEDPEKYLGCVANVILVNPAGFGRNSGFIGHCLRFLFFMVLKEYCYLGKRIMFQRNLSAEAQQTLVRKMRLTTSLLVKTVINPVKTVKEVADVISFRVAPYLKQLITENGFRFHVFINSNDNLLAPEETLRELHDLLPAQSVMICPGHHSDLFVDALQMHQFDAFLNNIMENKC
jgi:pimeloyl-ACP methyl ester carboxylesterase